MNTSRNLVAIVSALSITMTGACTVGDQVVDADEADVDRPYIAGGYVGCFRDDGQRALPHFAASNHDMTPQVCQSLCRGYAYAGVQYYSECWCGDELGYEQRPDGECNTPCLGDWAQKCGGAWKNSIYAAANDGDGPSCQELGGSSCQNTVCPLEYSINLGATHDCSVCCASTVSQHMFDDFACRGVDSWTLVGHHGNETGCRIACVNAGADCCEWYPPSGECYANYGAGAYLLSHGGWHATLL